MVSAIDATLPADGVLAQKSDFRANLAAGKSEIEALQAEVIALLAALALTSGQTTFPALGGDNTPADPSTLSVILLALDAAITAAAAGGGGGPITLASITDLNSPDVDARRAFQAAVGNTNKTASFTFNAATDAQTLITMDTTAAARVMTLPDTAGLGLADGWLCSVVLTSGANPGSIVSATTDQLRWQSGRTALPTTFTTLFVGPSTARGISSIVHVFLDGGVYRLEGSLRPDESDNLSFNAPSTLDLAAAIALTLASEAFPNALDLGGTKQAGGARGLMEDIAGNHTFVQANAGKTLVHTGAGAATWTVPTLLTRTTIDIVNDGGAINFVVQDAQATSGGLNLGADADGAVRWLPSGKVRFVGTT